VAHEIDDPGAVALLANGGRAVGIASMTRATRAVGHGLVVRPLIEPEVAVEICAVWDDDTARSSTARVLEAAGAR
jgi:DNA-binding transcriptional LysR family regulator